MREHTWETKTAKAPIFGSYDYQQCSVCGANGPSLFSAFPFYADGSGCKLSFDCDEAQIQIADHVATYVPPVTRPRAIPSVSVGPVTERPMFEEPSPEETALGYRLWGYKYDHLDTDQQVSFKEYCDEQHRLRWPSS